MLKRRFPEPEASGSAKRARQLDWDRESLQQQVHRVARSQVEGIPRAWRLQGHMSAVWQWSRRRRRNDETASRFLRPLSGSGRCKRGPWGAWGRPSGLPRP